MPTTHHSRPATSPPCDGRDPEWWDTGNDGNRLAMLICRTACTGCPTEDPNPTDVIRNGIPYGPNGKPRPLCGCGYPIDYGPATPTERPFCRRCRLPTLAMYRISVERWRAAGHSYQRIANRIGYDESVIRQAVSRWNRQANREPAPAPAPPTAHPITRRSIVPTDTLTTELRTEHGQPVWRVTGPAGAITYTAANHTLLAEPTNAAPETLTRRYADIIANMTATGTATDVFALLRGLHDRMDDITTPAPEECAA